MALKTNIVANYLGRGWASASIFLFVPIYIRVLGTESYGLVAFYSVLSSVVSVSNLGLSAVLTRELARNSVRPDSADETRSLVRTIETIFLWISAFSMLMVATFASIIANKWLNVTTIHSDQLTSCIKLMGIAMSLRLPIDMYYAGMNGLQRQVTSNTLQSILSTARHLSSIFVLLCISSTVEALFVSQTAVNIIELFVVRSKLWAFLPAGTIKPRFRSTTIHSILKYALGMAGISLVSILLSQVDKIVVSKLLTMEAFAAYSIASLLSRVPLIIAQPIADAVHPLLSQSVAEENTICLRDVYVRACSYVGVAVYPLGITVCFYSHDILYFWSRNLQLAESASTAAGILTLGSIFISILLVPYYLALAHGWTSLNLVTGVASLLFILPLTVVLTQNWGITGASVGWLALNAGIAIPYVLFLHSRTIREVNAAWFIRCNLIPGAIAYSVIAISSAALNSHEQTFWLRICSITFFWLLATYIAAMTVGEIRTHIFAILKHLCKSFLKLQTP